MGKRERRQNEREVLEIDVGDERRGASSRRLVCSDYKLGGGGFWPTGLICHQSKLPATFPFLEGSRTCFSVSFGGGGQLKGRSLRGKVQRLDKWVDGWRLGGGSGLSGWDVEQMTSRERHGERKRKLGILSVTDRIPEVTKQKYFQIFYLNTYLTCL